MRMRSRLPRGSPRELRVPATKPFGSAWSSRPSTFDSGAIVFRL
jgi:hypothetical protein